MRLPCRSAFQAFTSDRSATNAAFEDVGLAVEFLVLFAFGNDGADAGARVEAGDARSAGAHAFGERSLGTELHLDFAR